MIITVVGKFDFDAHVPRPSAAVLRIYDPNEDWSGDASQLAVAGWGEVLALSFWDVGVQGMRPAEALVARLLGRWRRLCLAVGAKLFGDAEVPWRPFLSADARDIARFAGGLEAAGVRHLLVVCGNGRARSLTIAKWLAARLGADLAPAHGWQRESDAIAKVLRRVPAPKAARTATSMPTLSPAE